MGFSTLPSTNGAARSVVGTARRKTTCAAVSASFRAMAGSIDRIQRAIRDIPRERMKMSNSPGPLRYDIVVPPDGRIEVQLPLPAASRVTVYVIEKPPQELDELTAASVSSTDFWNNPEDDEDWNDA
jgi:hypothetical protein